MRFSKLRTPFLCPEIAPEAENLLKTALIDAFASGVFAALSGFEGLFANVAVRLCSGLPLPWGIAPIAETSNLPFPQGGRFFY